MFMPTEDGQKRSSASARQLPRHMAVAAAVISFVVFLGSFALYLGLMWSAKTDVPWGFLLSPAYLGQMVKALLGTLVATALIAWAMTCSRIDKTRHRVETRPARVLSVFVIVFTLLSIMQAWGQWLFFSDLAAGRISRFAQHGDYALQLRMTFTSVTLSVLSRAGSLVVLAASCGFALKLGRGDPADASEAQAVRPPRYVVPAVGAAFLVSVQWLVGTALGPLLQLSSLLHSYFSVTIFLMGPWLVAGLAFAGAWLGVGQPAQARPWRALAAALSTLAVQYLVCIGLGRLWLLWVSGDNYYGVVSATDVRGLFMFLLIPYVLLLVFAMRGFMRVFYRRIQVPDPA